MKVAPPINIAYKSIVGINPNIIPACLADAWIIAIIKIAAK